MIIHCYLWIIIYYLEHTMKGVFIVIVWEQCIQIIEVLCAQCTPCKTSVYSSCDCILRYTWGILSWSQTTLQRASWVVLTLYSCDKNIISKKEGSFPIITRKKEIWRCSRYSPRFLGRQPSPYRPRGPGRTSLGLVGPRGLWEKFYVLLTFSFFGGLQLWMERLPRKKEMLATVSRGFLLARDINLLAGFELQKVNFAKWYSQLKS